MEKPKGALRGKSLFPSPDPRVLVIDDDVANRTLMTSVLSDAGMHVSSLDSSLGAMNAIIRRAPNVVVVDLGMPMISGEKLLGLIRKSSVLEHVRVVLTSERPLAELRRVGTALGADATLSKRDILEQLVSTVRGVLPETGATPLTGVLGTAFVVLGDAEVAELFRVRLTKAGFEVLVRSTGWGVPRYLAAHPPTLLFVADDLPGMRAAEILAPLREAGALDQTTIVMCGRRDDHDLIATAARLGIRRTMRYEAPDVLFDQKLRDFVGARKTTSGMRPRPI